MKIEDIRARIILASNKKETIEVELLTDKKRVVASVPAGISVGRYEVKYVEVEKAKEEVEGVIKEKILGMKVEEQEKIDLMLNKLVVGGNSRLSVSIAVCKAGENLKRMGRGKKPKYLFLIFEGGRHGYGGLKFQEYMVLVDDFSKGKEIFEKMSRCCEKEGINFQSGSEGAISPFKVNDKKVLGILKDQAEIEKIAIDVAASHFKEEVDLDYYEKIVEKYCVFLLEDPYKEDEWEKWAEINKRIGQKTLIIGDDLIATNLERLKRAILEKACNGIVVKPNQIGTVSETLEVIKKAKESNLKVVVSHRGAETKDDFIADLAYFTQADYVKFGGLKQEERLVKYNKMERLANE